MIKFYFILGSVLVGVGGYLLYNKVKNANVDFNTRNEDNIVQADIGSNLSSPMEVPSTTTDVTT